MKCTLVEHFKISMFLEYQKHMNISSSYVIHCILIFSFSEWIWFVGENPDIDANVDLKKKFDGFI